MKNLLTRREVIKLWQKQKDKFLDTYCCPNCRDLLFDYRHPASPGKIVDGGFLYCHNARCFEYNRAVKP
jgi:hypothetical protein